MLKETWAQSDLLDQLEALGDPEDLVALDIKVSLVTQAEMELLDLQDSKEREETLESKDLQD